MSCEVINMSCHVYISLQWNNGNIISQEASALTVDNQRLLVRSSQDPASRSLTLPSSCCACNRWAAYHYGLSVIMMAI